MHEASELLWAGVVVLCALHLCADVNVNIVLVKSPLAVQLGSCTSVILKHKNVSSIEEYNIGDRLKYSRIKQSSKKDIEESRINVKYQEHYRSIWNSAKCKMQSAKYNVQSAKYKVQSAKCKVQYRNFWNNAKY